MRKKELGETWFLDYAVIPRKHDVFELKFFFHGIDGKWFGVKPSWCMASTSWLSQIHSLFFKMRHRKEMPQVVSIPFQVPANASKIHRILGKPMKYALVDFQGVRVAVVSSEDRMKSEWIWGLWKQRNLLSLTWLCARMFPGPGQWDHACHRTGTPNQGHSNRRSFPIALGQWIEQCKPVCIKRLQILDIRLQMDATCFFVHWCLTYFV